MATQEQLSCMIYSGSGGNRYSLYKLALIPLKLLEISAYLNLLMFFHLSHKCVGNQALGNKMLMGHTFLD